MAKAKYLKEKEPKEKELDALRTKTLASNEKNKKSGEELMRRFEAEATKLARLKQKRLSGAHKYSTDKLDM